MVQDSGMRAAKSVMDRVFVISGQYTVHQKSTAPKTGDGSSAALDRFHVLPALPPGVAIGLSPINCPKLATLWKKYGEYAPDLRQGGKVIAPVPVAEENS